MFTIKFYNHDGADSKRRFITEAEKFSIWEEWTDKAHWFEVTTYNKENIVRYDVGKSPYEPAGGVFQSAIIENSNGKTTEILKPHEFR